MPKTNHHWLNHLQTPNTNTRLRHLAGGRCEGKLSNSWGSKRKSWTHLSSSFHLINTRNKKIKAQIHPAYSKNSSTTQIKLTHVANSRTVTHKSSVARCFLILQDFSRSNKHCIHLSTTKTIYFSRFVIAMSAFTPV